MPWSFRRSISKGPVRLNFSRRGVGVSVGVRGLRLGTGPRGTYVRGGRGGFYYQQYLRTQDPAFAPGPAAPHAQAGVPTEFVAEPNAHGDDAIAEINRRRASFRWSLAVVVAAVICAVWLASMHAAAGWYAPLLAALAYGGVVHSRENAHRAIAFHYDLEGDLAAEYGRLVAAFRDVGRCARIWRVVSQNMHGDQKHNAGARSSVERVPTALTFGTTRGLATNVDVASLDAAGTRVFFLPDKIVTIAGPRVGSIAYADLGVADGQTRFSEDQPLPADATRVGTTWLFVNKNGSADKRFKNNRQLPIALYSDLRLSHPELTLSLEFSRSDAAAALAGALRRFVAMLAAGIAPSAAVVPPPSSRGYGLKRHGSASAGRPHANDTRSLARRPRGRVRGAYPSERASSFAARLARVDRRAYSRNLGVHAGCRRAVFHGVAHRVSAQRGRRGRGLGPGRVDRIVPNRVRAAHRLGDNGRIRIAGADVPRCAIPDAGTHDRVFRGDCRPARTALRDGGG